MQGYWQTTRHPWPCLLFILPLLGVYEASMLYQAMEGLQPYRAGLDTWLHSILKQINWSAVFLPSLLTGLVCISWAVLKWDRSPPENISTMAGMFLESLVYALALWGLGAVLASQWPLLAINQKAIQASAYMGSGLFEEVFFRLCGFGLVVWVFRAIVSERNALVAAVFISAFGFAAAHYVGPWGDAWNWQTFVFRSLAGIAFALIFQYRGIGIAVGTHSAYNVVVGLVT